jgi:hypothetical protein
LQVVEEAVTEKVLVVEAVAEAIAQVTHQVVEFQLQKNLAVVQVLSQMFLYL